jgi:dipeptidyl aminopeptidase/acylaminoacyl peptidase
VRTLHLSLAVLLGLVMTTLSAQDAAKPDPEKAKQIAELEKQLADLQGKLTKLKDASVPKPVLAMKDVLTWKTLASDQLSNDGNWLAYRLVPAEGDGEVIVRSTKTDKEYKFPAGSGPGTFDFSEDSQYAAFTVNPPSTMARIASILPSSVRRPQPKVILVKLADGTKTEFEGVRRFAFSGEAASHFVLQRNPAEAASSTLPTLPAGITLPASLAAATGASTASGSDLLIHELATGSQLVLGNVSDFGFDKSGKHLVMLIDAKDQVGNGIQIRTLASGTVQSIDSGKASYQSLDWNEDENAFTVKKAVEDSSFENKQVSIIGVQFTEKGPVKTVYDPKEDKTFPKELVISTSRGVNWNDDFQSFIFGVVENKKKTSSSPVAKDGKEPEKKDGKEPEKKDGAPATKAAAANDKPDLVIWHWKDERIQPMQQVQQDTDRRFAYTAVYHLNSKKFVRLADDALRNVTLSPRHKIAIGLDAKPYERMGNLDGKRVRDVYSVDPQTGEKKKIATKLRFVMGASPDGKWLLFHDQGHFQVVEVATGVLKNLTQGVPATFYDVEDDHPVDKPPTPVMGWSKDSTAIWVSDGWDVWQLSVTGAPAINRTVDGKKDQLRYRARFVLDPEEKGIDISKPQMLGFYGEWSKKTGILKLDPAANGGAKLLNVDAEVTSLKKAKKAETFTYRKETSNEYPDVYVADATLQNGKKLTDANPQQAKFAWSSGAKLIEYTGTKGTKLQGALYLPANYEAGKSYPCVVYIYEKLTDNFHKYKMPRAYGFDAATYTSAGYAVLNPDITYQINDPGISSVTCVTAALDAAVKTGIVDKARVGLQGHSWGGYQTAFIITQSNAFKAACAGAPLTNLVSMYSSIYWNSGSANQPIFESSQGRFTGGYWEQQEAYLRNSPVFHATKVQTPLLLLHNDKDGAVDFTQGIEYYNTLRRLDKSVVMLQYKGENHGLAKPANRKDYYVRMREYFDHYLQGKPAPKWMTEGVPLLKMDEHLKETRGGS